ncbi:Aspartyl-tRNA(Asn) amidotransferase subunit B @ Glutamyl-tRNA(Gln) amidotransferase subunit B [invertebrate metagenome]|uniref:Aspartyl-tRNA(Asn) amidotransferase subunit B @ Glutamyl-tRNA(Gln) amidotransferase subunit B n=1 Tax=invertebrate metagenome TaxID=1711999 RepID=A0A484H9A9_9ZZZZ
MLEGKTGPWKMVIGLEIHAQVTSRAKLFSGAATSFGGAPNRQVSLVDAAFPGMLPVINAKCVEQAVRTGLGLNAHVHKHSVFTRKHYFYADLPAGYQISQYERPIVGPGLVTIDLSDGTSRDIRIERLHLEQDAGKSLHDQHPTRSYIDLNRAGIALMEIVSRPDMQSSEEAAAYVRKLRSILRYLGSCDGNMQEGSLRCDVNVSVRRPAEEGLRTRCEIKNLNSVRFMVQAIEYEAHRHVRVYESGSRIQQETRLFDASSGMTRSMRAKEMAHDYRYFPDPDLLPLELDDAFIEDIRQSLPELPDQKKARFMSSYGLPAYDARVLVEDRATADYYETVAKGRDPKTAANWVITNLFGVLHRRGREIINSPVSADNLGQLLDLIGDGTISGHIAKSVFEIMLETGQEPLAIVAAQGLKQVTDSWAIEQAIDVVMRQNADQVALYRTGQVKLLGWFVGQVMKATGGKAHPGKLNMLLKQKLES